MDVIDYGQYGLDLAEQLQLPVVVEESEIVEELELSVTIKWRVPRHETYVQPGNPRTLAVLEASWRTPMGNILNDPERGSYLPGVDEPIPFEVVADARSV